METLVKFEVDGAVARVTLSRPEKRNALKRETLESLAEALTSVENNNEIRVLILASEGGVFCAGMDLGEMQERASSPNSALEWQRDSEVYCDVLERLYGLRVPTVAVVSGPALAGGVGLVLACDMVLAVDDAFFALPEPMRGITAAMVTPLLVHRVGAGAATALLLSGERWSTERAYQLGLCHDVVARESLPDRTEQLTRAILSGSTAALALTKQHIDRISGMDMSQMLRSSMTVSATARETSDAREGLQAFLEKRKPNWQPAE
ncbi:MAG: enoyl-CoA hydratase-related protein [Pirellulaceae bacterium]